MFHKIMEGVIMKLNNEEKECILAVIGVAVLVFVVLAFAIPQI